MKGCLAGVAGKLLAGQAIASLGQLTLQIAGDWQECYLCSCTVRVLSQISPVLCVAIIITSALRVTRHSVCC